MYENRLRELRERTDYKAKEIAAYLGVTESMYCQWEHNKTYIPTKRLIQIANIYHVNIDYIIKLTNNKKEIKPSNQDLTLIGKRLKEARKSLNYSLRELCGYLNSSFSSFASYERAECLIQSETLISFCRLTGYSSDWLLGRSDEMKTSKN